ncbi:MAG: nuclear transport factor 2 family protein [Acidobacteria bacterium]|nr:MAG: nuclear transport factor 2 family protein [Acidobacteriota bacterium]
MSVVFLSFFLLAGSPNTDVANEIRELTVEFNETYERNELDKYFSYYADDLTQWFESGRVTLEQYKTDWYALIEAGGGVESTELSDLQVQVGPDGRTAVATYVATVVTRSPEGKRTKEQAWETDIWFKRDGQWKIVHLHYNSHEVP